MAKKVFWTVVSGVFIALSVANFCLLQKSAADYWTEVANNMKAVGTQQIASGRR